VVSFLFLYCFNYVKIKDILNMKKTKTNDLTLSIKTI